MSLLTTISGIYVLLTLGYIIILSSSLHRRDFHQVGKLALAAGILFVPAALLYWLSYNLFRSISFSSDPIIAFLLFIIILLSLAALIYIVWQRIPKLISLFFLHEIFDSNLILQEYSRSISNITNSEQLTQVSLDLICQALKAHHGFLFEAIYEQGSNAPIHRLVGTGFAGKGKPEDLTFDPTNRLPIFFEQTHQVQIWSDPDQVRINLSLSPQEYSWLSNLCGEIFAPIHSGNEWIGLIVLGPKISNLPYHAEELTLLHTLTDQLSLAIKNARLVDSLMRVNNDFRRAYQAMEQSNLHFQQALSQLQKIDQTKSDFISIASHELLTPITIMRGYTEILLEDPVIVENDYHIRMLNGIHTGIMRLNEIIETMLDMANIDASSLSLHKVDVSLGYVIQSLTKSLKLTLEQRNITLTLEGLSDLPVIRADQEALRKVFNHLILNAVQKTPNEGKINITGLPISHGQAGLSEGGVEIIISDTGIGIKREHLDLIFTKFYQASNPQHHSSGKIKFKGSGPGLGLAVAKGIVEAHGGKIWAESPGYDEEKCPGSQFHVMLPC
jgi:signal transduction histidine kinase